MKENYPEIDNSQLLYYKFGRTWNAARLDGIKESKENYDLGLGHITSFYQSKRDHLKKKATHWIGKFMIVKAENNRIRIINKAFSNEITELRRHITELNIAYEASAIEFVEIVARFKPQGHIEVVGKDAVQKVEKTVHEKEPCKC